MQAKSSQETVWVAQDSKILKSTQVFLSVSVAHVAYGWSKVERTQRKETETILIHCMTEKITRRTNISGASADLVHLGAGQHSLAQH